MWDLDVEMDGALNTNFDGTQFVNGSGDIPHPPTNQSNAILKEFPNSRMDFIKYTCADSIIGQAAVTAYTNFGGA